MHLDNTAFKKAQLTVEDRINKQPIELPIPAQTLKAIVADMVGGRPKSKDRHLVSSQSAPHGPIVHIMAAGMGCIRTSGDLVAWMQMTRRMKLADAKQYVADKLEIAVIDQGK
jgi:hypothetical protein